MIFTIEEFCVFYRMSRSTYFRMRKAGDGPQEQRSGRQIQITQEAAERWERDLAAKSHAPRLADETA